MRILPAVLVTALLSLAAPALGHVTTTVAPLTAPLVVGVPTQVEVTFSEPCFEVAPQEVVDGHDTMMAGLHPDAPDTILWVGETVPFTTDMCDPSAVPLAVVRATAVLTITATADAPGLTNLTLPVTSYVGGGSEPGETADLNVTIAHHANGTLTAAEPSQAGASAHAGHDTLGKAVALRLVYTTNAESLLTFEAKASSGTVHEINATRLAPPSFSNASSAQVDVLATFEPASDWTTSKLTFAAYLTPIAGGARVPVGNATLVLDNDAAGGPHGDDGHGDEHSGDTKGTPAPAFALVALALLAFAARRR